MRALLRDLARTRPVARAHAEALGEFLAALHVPAPDAVAVLRAAWTLGLAAPVHTGER